MPKISFNAQALGIATYDKCGNVGHSASCCPLQPVMVSRPGIEAIIEGLRLANVKGFDAYLIDKPAGDVDS